MQPRCDNRRVLGRLTWLFVVAVALMLAAVQSAAADPADDTALAARFAPVIRLVNQPERCGEGDPYVPTDVNLLFDNPTVALRGPWARDNLVVL